MADVVAAQYEKWIYPQPIMDLAEYCGKGMTDGVAPHYLHPLFWPDGEYERREGKINILVAGCGANAAARYAYQHPNAQVTGIDLSEASLNHERYLQEKHQLNNLSLRQLRIEEVSSLGQQFDFIDSVGVLHHLPNPEEGLRQLKTVLKPNGVMGLMLYGLYGRVGVYMLQEFFHRLYLQQTEGDVAVVKETLTQLPKAQLDRLRFTELSYDAGLVDLFLHPIDRGYTVESCLDYVESCGMTLQGWVESRLYYPEGQVQPNTVLWKMLNLLPEPERWKAMELFNGGISKHLFYVCHQERPIHSYRIQFEDEQFLDYIPRRRVLRANQPEPASIGNWLDAPATGSEHANLINRLFSLIGGQNTVRDCLEQAALPGSHEQITEYVRQVFQTLWRMEYVMFNIPAV